MGILDWFRKRSAKSDQGALDHEAEMSKDTPAERAASSGDIEGIAADNEAAERLGEGETLGEAERLSE